MAVEPHGTGAPGAAMRICVIFNPAARGDKARRFRRQLEVIAGDCVLKPTSAPGTGRRLAAEAVGEGFDCVVAAGGDGTLNEVLNGVADVPGGLASTRLGVLPLGTANVFARELGLPLRWRAAWEVLRQGRERRLDLVRVEHQTPDGPATRCFLQLAGAGLDARATQLVDWGWKKRAGFMAYIAAGLRALREPQPRITVKVGADEVYGALVLMGNGACYGGPFRLFPHADPCDGRLDVRVFPKADARLVLACLGGILTGRLGRVGRSRDFRARTLSLRAASPTPLQLDGEHVGELPAEVAVLPGAARVLGR